MPSLVATLPRSMVHPLTLLASATLHLGIALLLPGQARGQRAAEGEQPAVVLTFEVHDPKPETNIPKLSAEKEPLAIPRATPTAPQDTHNLPRQVSQPHKPWPSQSPEDPKTPTVVDAPTSDTETVTAPASEASGEVAANGRPGGAGVLAGAPSGTPRDRKNQPIIGPRYDAAYLKNERPRYPAAARRMKLEDTATLRVLVSSDGRAQRVCLQLSSGFRVLDEAAVEAVKQWSFVPARQGDNPIATEVDVPVRFRLSQAENP